MNGTRTLPVKEIIEMNIEKHGLIVLLLLLFAIPFAGAQEARNQGHEKIQGLGYAGKPAKARLVLPAVPGALEEGLALAMKRNPDLAVVRADVDLAAAGLNQVRIEITRAVIEAYHEGRLIRNRMEIAGSRLDRIRKLREKGTVGSGEVEEAAHEYIAAQTEVARRDAMLRTLVGAGSMKAELSKDLDALIAQALNSNGEVALARAKVVKMQARMDQVRLEVTREVITAYQDLDLLESSRTLAQLALKRASERVEKGMVSEEELHKALREQAEVEGERIRREAVIRYLVGLAPVLEK